LEKYSKFKIGTIQGEVCQIEVSKPGDFSKVPYAELSAFQGFHSPYYNESHFRFRKAVREFIATEILPEALSFDDLGKPASVEAFKKMGQFGLLACRMGPGPHLKSFKLPGGVKHDEFDYFHEQIGIFFCLSSTRRNCTHGITWLSRFDCYGNGHWITACNDFWSKTSQGKSCSASIVGRKTNLFGD
jgi:hypothetical protein